MIHTGDCLDILPTLEPDSIDSIVTDPPAGIAFMSKHWDRDKGGRTEWVAWMTEVMRECYRVLKPGGYAVVWSLPRTCHWTGWAMEDAGFIIRDQLAHIFASGFPKGKAQLKPAREDWWLARKPGPLRPLAIDATRIPSTGGGGERLGEESADRRYTDNGGTNLAPLPGPRGGDVDGRWPSNVLLETPELFDVANPYVVGSGAVLGVSAGVSAGDPDGHGIYNKAFPRGDGREVGYGDSGGYSRFFIVPKADRADREPVLRGQVQSREGADPMAGHRGRRMDGDVKVRPDGKVSAARENLHPTVKPVDLMCHLVRLVTPVGGTVLDPFLGSGSTAIACELEGFPWIGIEKDESYVAIAEARLNGTQRGLGLDVAAPVRKRSRPESKNPDRFDGVPRWQDWKAKMKGPEEAA